MSTKATTGSVEQQQRDEQSELTTGVERWQAGVVAGLLGAVAFSALLAISAPAALTAAIPSMYGLSGGMAGMGIHLSHGALLGVVFVAVLRLWPDPGRTVTRAAIAGTAYGVVLWGILAVFVMPLWLSAVGFAGAPSLPAFDLMSLVGHVLYGIVLGATYPRLRR
ncbi:DUF6789 family protein [Halogeometricum borinquense]|uniref:DUF6789 family protein n=1 Tax=Halogeometricum borinquense TaxID=60847 RepID=UPI001F4CBB41|nr:DUF6789 family protein [Halogeometricum borinquense]